MMESLRIISDVTSQRFIKRQTTQHLIKGKTMKKALVTLTILLLSGMLGYSYSDRTDVTITVKDEIQNKEK